MTAQRVTAPLVKGIIDDRLTKHADVYDKTILRHDILLVGEKGDDGYNNEIQDRPDVKAVIANHDPTPIPVETLEEKIRKIAKEEIKKEKKK